MQSFWHPSLRLRILAPAALVAIPVIALLFYMSLDRRRQAEREVTLLAERLADLKAVYQEEAVEAVRQLLVAVSQSRDVREGDADACSAYLRQLLPKVGAKYANLGVLDREGRLVCSAVPAGAIDLSGQYYKRALETRTFAVGEFIVSPLTRKAVAAVFLSGARRVQERASGHLRDR